MKICVHSERYINITADTFELNRYFDNIVFPLASTSCSLFLQDTACLLKRLLSLKRQELGVTEWAA